MWRGAEYSANPSSHTFYMAVPVSMCSAAQVMTINDSPPSIFARDARIPLENFSAQSICYSWLARVEPVISLTVKSRNSPNRASRISNIRHVVASTNVWQMDCVMTQKPTRRFGELVPIKVGNRVIAPNIAESVRTMFIERSYSFLHLQNLLIIVESRRTPGSESEKFYCC